MNDLNINNSLIESLKNLTNILKQVTLTYRKTSIEITIFNQTTKESESGFSKLSSGFNDIIKGVIGSHEKINNLNSLLVNTDGKFKVIEKVKLFGSNLKTLGKELLKPIQRLWAFITGLFVKNGALDLGIKKLRVYAIRTAQAGLAALKAGGRMAISALRGIGVFVASIISATTAQTGFNIAVAANPLGALILGIMAVVGAIALVISYWDEIKAAIARFVVWVFEHSPFGFLINVVDNIFPGFKDALGSLFDWVVNTFTQIADFVKNLWKSIKGWFGFGDGEEATVTVSPDENGNFTGEATDANGDPLGLATGAATGATTAQNTSRSVTDYTATSPEAISRPPTATPSSGSSSTVNNNSKNVSVRIENLVKNLNLNVTNMQEGSAKIRDEVNRALIAAIRDTEIAIG